MKARIRGERILAEVETAEVCFHCRGAGSCDCAGCGQPGPTQGDPLRWVAGACEPCHGTGYLAWRRDVIGLKDAARVA